MLPEIGHFALILALIAAVLQVALPSMGLWRGNVALTQLSKPLLWMQFFWILVSFALLMNAFLVDDFSVKYVASNSNTQLPDIFKISAVWGAHEGSLLLWALVLSVWSVAVSIFSKRLPSEVLNHILIILGLISIGFLLFLLLTSNPFERLDIVPIQGRELNPLLQDFGLIIHPPMLYMGYVGMSIPFAFVLSSLIRGQLDSTWLRWSRPWTLVAWAFLTFGIVLGSWWAYYELGWGGWWFWDPVENASFMPWLVATALVHSLSVSEKRSAFKHWTVLLAISGFSLSLLGTFLVRSGILTSVHSFASDPARGFFILVFLMLVVGGSLSLYAWRANLMCSNNSFEPLSRESGLLTNNILLVAATLVVFSGTLYPLLLDSLGWGKISVGAPYFDVMFTAVMIPAVLVMALAGFLRWKKDKLDRVVDITIHTAFVASTITLITYFAIDNIYVVLATFLSSWVILHSLLLLAQRLRQRGNPGTAFLGMVVAHIGIAVFLFGATVTTQYGVEKDIKMSLNETVEIKGYAFTFKGVSALQGANYTGNKGVIDVAYQGAKIATLKPEKRQYVTGMPMTEAAIDPSLFRDLYIALGESLGEGAWSLRLYYKPLIRWIWLGGLLIMLGALLAAFDRRYRLKYKVKS
ncbi:heme lyase CcmF/NrfE family subunit [bacterium endosymbiont of Bathymodiolus sp. 5 South]|jgi:cytochrome c-type biogenesis protein CcmF|uniref:heme lyase CcmF/NrfE family subunit n=1 Tax=bacterium endosymbiont of Bathymodiolus sp. 5 South TaxID=1181670 RepID=UPI000255FEC6|nr:heme lyase CcmF/NrfE family subunit [bacterium endosymbiont of Bathymodiolus sp. 5 South]CAC9439218.1 Cytochrome c heme lyase subunit CcmF [uncultured Gammaproteobacteria bacterium]CAC9445632.1 Cytochrome c heme lyase subunit CcmF [uncultured Gammaproteobacteria bacterium]CAC9649681.1 Cytochrome c heme lyase subunit CcmF [uncultured Gammaproteobacteria bacterium]SHN90594.1 Cytochrome c-type biogenesis protein CcmF [bacterium endosymbiont of Bathymodiolus sp. 5 South]SSC08338.1 Cytochrome c 